MDSKIDSENVTLVIQTDTSSNSGVTWTPLSTNTIPITRVRRSATWSGESTKGFHAALRSGQLIPYNAYSNLVTETMYTPVNGRYIDKNGSLWSRQTFPEWSGLTTPGNGVTWPTLDHSSVVMYTGDLTSQSAAVLQEAAAEISSKGLDALTFVAEIGKLRQLCVKLLKRLVTLRSNLVDTKLLQVPGLWLEYSFGLRPLLSDLMDLDNEVRRIKKVGSSEIVVGKSAFEVPGVIPTFSYTYDAGGGTIVKCQEKYSCKISLRGQVGVERFVGGWQFNPVATAWELVPLSWVVDYIFSVSNAIFAAQTMFVSTRSTSSLGKYTELTKSRFTSVDLNNSVADYAVSGGQTLVYRHKLREPTDYTLIPQPGLNIGPYQASYIISAVLSQLANAEIDEKNKAWKWKKIR